MTFKCPGWPVRALVVLSIGQTLMILFFLHKSTPYSSTSLESQENLGGILNPLGTTQLRQMEESFKTDTSGQLLELGLDNGGLRTVTTEIDMSKKYDICSVGAGLSGTIFAERYAELYDKKALVIDSRPHFGGNLYDYVDPETGVLVNKYGAHLFHTNSEKAWHYLNMFERKGAPKWERWDHEVIGMVKGKLVPIPVNINTVNRLFNLAIRNEEEMNKWLEDVQIPCPESGCEDAEQMAVSRVGKGLFQSIFADYTKKQWNKEAKDLDALVTARIPVRNNFDPRYFGDKYQALPSKGYTAWFAKVLDHKNIDVALTVDYFDHKDHLDEACGKIVYTGPIDRYFASEGFEKLEYRGIEFEIKRYYNTDGYKLPNSVVNFPGPEVDYTRIVEYRHFLNQQTPHTVTVAEYSKDMGPNDDPYYPVPNPRNQALYEKYQKLAEDRERESGGKIHFVGRLANYKYFNMDATIVNALDTFYEVEGHPDMKDMSAFFGENAQDEVAGEGFVVGDKTKGFRANYKSGTNAAKEKDWGG